MPLPKKGEKETPEEFMSRCMGDDKAKTEFPDQKQRTAICMGRACKELDYVEAGDFKFTYEAYGYEEELTQDNFIIPEESQYEDFGEEEFEWDIAVDRPGLWENIRKKKEREGKKYKPAKPGDPDRPDPESWKKAQKPKAEYKYKAPKTGEYYYYDRQGIYKKDGRTLVFVAKSAEYQGRTVKLNKPFRTPDGPKKFSVYVKNQKGNVVKVNFGDPNMEIKKDDPARRKSFRARHNCDNPGPKWKARYWSCKNW